MGIPLMTGREFTRADAFGAPKVAIVNQAFAKKFNLGDNPLGKHFGLGGGPNTKLDIEIVGMVKDAKYSEVKREIQPVFFTPYRQDKEIGSITFYARTRLAEAELLQAIPRIVGRLDPNLPVEDLRTMATQVRQNTGVDRMITILSAAFAGIATLLAAIGLYGVLAYTVSQRTREFGLRMALGADGGRVRRLVLGRVGWMTLAGATVGVAGAVGAAMFISSQSREMLYELKPYDPQVLIASTALLVLVAFAAGYIPALRASRVNPMTALRND